MIGDIILLVGLGIINIFDILAFIILSRELKYLHQDVRKVREYTFWSQKREIEARKILRKKKQSHRMRYKASIK